MNMLLFSVSFSFRDDGSIFDGLVEEDDKDKAKRWLSL